MPRRGGKRMQMDDPVPMEYEEDMYRVEAGGGSDHLNKSYSDRDVGDSPVKGGRMTRLKARGGVRDRPPIVDDDDDEIYHAPPPTQSDRKRKAGAERKPVAEEIVERVEKPIIEKPTVVHHHHDRERDVTEDETSLYCIIRNSKSAIASIVDDWIEQYKQDRDNALMVLIQFFINASGFKSRITKEISFMEHTAIIREMTEEFDEESGEYPLIMPGQQWKKFKVNFCDFVQTLVKQCQYSIIFGQFLMDHLISLLTGLTDSQVRAFRNTATLVAMKLMIASKFEDRIVAMTLDKEFEVAVIAVKLVIRILKIRPDILTNKDCEIVYKLVYSSLSGISQTAAEFLNVRLFHLEEDSMDVVKTKRGKKRLPNTQLIRFLVQFFIESELNKYDFFSL